MVYQQERLASFIKKELAIFLEKIPKEEGVFFSVTRVEIDSGLEKAKVYISIFPKNKSKNNFLSIKRLSSDARRLISGKLKRHKIPYLIFVLDEGGDQEARLEKLLSQVQNEEK